jgi:hypothetical protein
MQSRTSRGLAIAGRGPVDASVVEWFAGLCVRQDIPLGVRVTTPGSGTARSRANAVRPEASKGDHEPTRTTRDPNRTATRRRTDKNGRPGGAVTQLPEKLAHTCILECRRHGMSQSRARSRCRSALDRLRRSHTTPGTSNAGSGEPAHDESVHGDVRPSAAQHGRPQVPRRQHRLATQCRDRPARAVWQPDRCRVPRRQCDACSVLVSSARDSAPPDGCVRRCRGFNAVVFGEPQRAVAPGNSR